MKKATGKASENLAEEYLTSKGYTIVQRNFSCRWGEIDLVCHFGKWLVFVEVRSRHGSKYGSPEESIDHRKISKIRKTAFEYLGSHQDTRSLKMRFDFIGIVYEDNDVRINHIEGAF